MSGSDPRIPAPVRAEIQRRMEDICSQENVQVLLVVESGSRAWGFPSPDSDYDVRFVYARSREEYLALSPKRDVIEQPIVDEIDLAGWDIRKALGLLLNNNAVLSEWIDSPIRYRPDADVISDLAALCERYFNPRGYALHYANLGKKAVDRWGIEGDGVRVKKLFYALRPALAIRALRLDPSRRPPMNLQRLAAVGDLPNSLERQIDDLVIQKAQTKEAGLASPLPEIISLIRDELSRANEVPEQRNSVAFESDANALFLRLVN